MCRSMHFTEWLSFGTWVSKIDTAMATKKIILHLQANSILIPALAPVSNVVLGWLVQAKGAGFYFDLWIAYEYMQLNWGLDLCWRHHMVFLTRYPPSCHAKLIILHSCCMCCISDFCDWNFLTWFSSPSLCITLRVYFLLSLFYFPSQYMSSQFPN
jgi:hypothetical protein